MAQEQQRDQMGIESGLDPGSAFLVEAFDPANRANPYSLYAKMRETQPVLDGGFGLWFAFTHEATHWLLRSRTTSSDERTSNEFKANVVTDERLQKYAAAEPLMLFTDPPDHTRLRSLVSRAFTPRIVEQLRPRLDALATELVDNIDKMDSSSFDLVEHIAYPYPVTIICELLGVPQSDIELFQSMSDALTLTVEPNALRSEDQQAEVEQARDDLSAYIAGLLNDRRRSPGNDLISGLLAARDGEDRLTESELIAMVTLLLLAGHETTVNLIGNAMVALMRHPDQLALWRNDPSIRRNAIDELTRYDSPVQMAMRVLTEDTEIDGVLLPKGDQVITLLGSANRDPNTFDDPDRLDLTRPNAIVNMSFGGGVHHCLGMALARTEAEIMLGTLIDRFGHLELAEEPTLRERFVLRGFSKIMVNARR